MIDINYDFLQRLIRNLGELFGDKCEIVVHDYRNGLDHTIIDIVNGQVTGRSIGGCPSKSIVEKLSSNLDGADNELVYFTNCEKGKIIKSATTYIKDNDNHIIGSVCVNMDITDLLLAENALKAFINYTPSAPAVENSEVLVRNVDELLQYYMNEVERMIGKPMGLMSKAEKVQALRYLDQKGVFKIAKASISLCEAFHISKYTLYSYLEESRN